MRFPISIRYKILGVLGGLLLVAISCYTWLASSIFRQEKTALLYDINHSLAVNLAAQLRAAMLQTSNQLRMQLFTELSSGSNKKLSSKGLHDEQIVGAVLFKKEGVGFKNIPFSANQALSDYAEDKILSHLEEVHAFGYSLWSEPSEPPRFFLGSEIEVKEGTESQLYYAIAELDRKLFFAPLQSANLFQSYLSKEKGDVILSFNGSRFEASTPMPEHPLLRAAMERKGTTSGVLAFKIKESEWYGAYAPLGVGGLYLLSQASRTEVNKAITILIQRSLLFGLIVLTATFMASVLFSRRLTRNLNVLTLSAQAIEQGKLFTRIKIRSGDEIEALAKTFNSMIAALRASRNKIERHNRELESKVAERTQQLHEINAQIKEVQEQLLQRTQLAAVGEVAGRTAHQILNPLTAISSRLERARDDVEKTYRELPGQFSEILKAWETEYQGGGSQRLWASLEKPSTVQPALSLFEEDLQNLKSLCQSWSEEHKDVGANLKFVHQETERIHHIVDQMRQLIRSSEVREDVECHTHLQTALATMRDFTGKHGIVIKTDFRAETDKAHLNKDEFMQIVTNLVRNAYQAIVSEANGKKSDGMIEVKTFNEASLLKIQVSDNGCGIPLDKQRLIFDQGFTTKSPTEGTGLGLAICRRYARAFGGDVTLISSDSTKGTTFEIQVPLLEAPELKIAV